MISVIVPVYNVQAYVDECVESIVSQTYKDLEIILVNDGSTDASLLHCEQWARRDPRIKIVDKPNGGLSSARNAGLDVATGQFIGFVDSDDRVAPDMYEQLIRPMSDPSVGITCCLVTAFDSRGQWPYKPSWTVEAPTRTPHADFALSIIRGDVCVTAWSKLYRAELLRDVRFREGRNNEDSLFHFELAPELERRRLDMLTIPAWTYLYRMRQGSICNSNRTPLHVEVLKNIEEYAYFYRSRGDRREARVREVYARTLFNFLIEALRNPFWADTYFWPYRRLFASLPLAEVRRSLSPSDFRSALAIRFLPAIYVPFKRLRERRRNR